MTRNYDAAFIGGAKFPGVVKKSRAKHKALLCTSFGDVKKLTRELAADERTDAIQWYGVWRDGHDFGEKQCKEAIERAKELEAIAAQHPEKEYFFAPFLEHEQSAKFMLALFARIEAVTSHLTLVNSPVGKGQYINDKTGKYVDELHLGKINKKPTGKRYFVSYDGRASTPKVDNGFKNGTVDAPHKKLLEQFADAEVFMLWILQFNGKKNTKDATARPNRKAYPSGALELSVWFYSTELGEMELPAGWLYGSHAEQATDSGKGVYENKPFVITPKARPKQIQLVTLDKKHVIATVKTSVKYKHGNGYLYRFTGWGFRMAEKAIQLQGKATCLLVADGKIIGKVNPGIRFPGR